jgi:hypothetical protein
VLTSLALLLPGFAVLALAALMAFFSSFLLDWDASDWDAGGDPGR